MNIAITMCGWRRPDTLGEVIDSMVAAECNAYPIHISIDGGFPDEQKEMIECIGEKLGGQELEPEVTVHKENIGAPTNLFQVLDQPDLQGERFRCSISLFAHPFRGAS